MFVRLIALHTTVMVITLTLSHFLVPLGVLAQGDCEFTLGFKTLRDKIPEIVGDCLENEHFDPAAGSVWQQTTGGVLRWRKGDGWTTFTDTAEETIWIDGPDGVSSRPYARPQPATLPTARTEKSPADAVRKPWWDLPTPPTPVQHPVPAQVAVALPPWAQQRAEELLAADAIRQASSSQAGQSGSPVESGGLRLSVLTVQRRWTAQFSQPPAGMEYVTIDVRFDNPTSTLRDYHVASFQLITGDGARWPFGLRRKPSLGSGQLLPGTSVHGWITFEIPAGAPIRKLHWDPVVGPTVEIDL